MRAEKEVDRPVTEAIYECVGCSYRFTEKAFESS